MYLQRRYRKSASSCRAGRQQAKRRHRTRRSGDVWAGVVGEWQGFPLWPRWIAAPVLPGDRPAIPDLQVSEDPLDNRRFIDQRNDAHDRAAVGALKRIDLVDFLNQPGPIGLAPPVGWPVVDRDLCVLFALGFCPPACAARAVGVVAVITHQVLVLVGNVIEQQAQLLKPES